MYEETAPGPCHPPKGTLAVMKRWYVEAPDVAERVGLPEAARTTARCPKGRDR